MVWETGKKAVKIVLLDGGTELAWENGSRNEQKKVARLHLDNWRIMALKWVEREAWVLYWRHWVLGTGAGEGQS